MSWSIPDRWISRIEDEEPHTTLPDINDEDNGEDADEDDDNGYGGDPLCLIMRLM